MVPTTVGRGSLSPAPRPLRGVAPLPLRWRPRRLSLCPVSTRSALTCPYPVATGRVPLDGRESNTRSEIWPDLPAPVGLPPTDSGHRPMRGVFHTEPAKPPHRFPGCPHLHPPSVCARRRDSNPDLPCPRLRRWWGLCQLSYVSGPLSDDPTTTRRCSIPTRPDRVRFERLRRAVEPLDECESNARSEARPGLPGPGGPYRLPSAVIVHRATCELHVQRPVARLCAMHTDPIRSQRPPGVDPRPRSPRPPPVTTIDPESDSGVDGPTARGRPAAVTLVASSARICTGVRSG